MFGGILMNRWCFLFPVAAMVAVVSCARADWPGTWGEAMAGAIGDSVETGKIPGAVLHVEHGGEPFRHVAGWRAVLPEVEPMTEDTIFDVASLTKVVATTSAIMHLVERGKVSLDAPVGAYVRGFAGDGRAAVTVGHLLTHVSGLPPGIRHDVAAPWSGYDEGIRRACLEPLRSTPGTAFVYSDVNFILLGEIIRQASGQWISEYTREHIFEPLDMRDTGFVPAASLRWRVAPTEYGADGVPLRGVVHDPTSRRMGGRCGHAGLFSTASDLARFCRMVLNGGVLDGRRVLAEATVAAMTRVQTPETLAERRGFGWDVATRFSGQRGSWFSEGLSFGHTGWTGPSLWIDPVSRTFVVFTANRNHPTEAGAVSALRARLGTLAAESVAAWSDVPLPGLPLTVASPPAGLVVARRVSAPVLTGLDVMRRDGFAVLRGRRVGLITNHTGLARDGTPAIDLLHAAPDVTLVALFSPEHGIRGALDRDGIADSRDEKTGLPVYSLYGERRAPSADQLASIDTLVFDIQDIGCRFYTYISTMTLAMEAAAKQGKRFVVLDRPNPIGGTAVGGPLREGGFEFIAAHKIPLRHGLTAGELARLIAAERKWKLDLEVIRCENWKRSQWYDETGLPWVNPSPNMRSLEAAALYPGIGMLEFTNLSVGRGTDAPFLVVGAPWVDEAALARDLSSAGLAGVRVTAVRFTPTASKFENQLCRGVRFIITDREALDSIALGSALASSLCRRHAADFDTRNLNKLLLHKASADAIVAGVPWPEIRALWRKDERAFILRRRAHLLYK
jgi:uncharacterized protein YbbC (DUF1343 family)/CubicO group peptidase (beta-lactamase class C family)